MCNHILKTWPLFSFSLQVEWVLIEKKLCNGELLSWTRAPVMLVHNLISSLIPARVLLFILPVAKSHPLSLVLIVLST